MNNDAFDSQQGQSLLMGIVAGEASGDQLAAGLMRELKKRLPHARFVGIGGPQMLAEGFESLADMERLSVMGFVEPLRRLPELFSIRTRLKRYFIAHQPAIFIGIDSPDFNLGLEKQLKAAGITTCHYVCPSVWAWRQGRVKKIRRSVDHVLALLPFEADFLREHDIAASFVGHPLAERLAEIRPESHRPDMLAARRQLLGDEPSMVLCVMPGSRGSEVDALFAVFLAVIKLCCRANPSLRVVIPAANPARYQQLQQLLQQADDASVNTQLVLLEGRSHLAMQAADVVLLASGTATLEAAMLGKPMVVAYRLSALTYAIASTMVKVQHIALPNLLTARPLIPEFIQSEATAENISRALLHFLDNPAARNEVITAFVALRQSLTRQADRQAAEVVLSLLGITPDGSNKPMAN